MNRTGVPTSCDWFRLPALGSKLTAIRCVGDAMCTSTVHDIRPFSSALCGIVAHPIADEGGPASLMPPSLSLIMIEATLAKIPFLVIWIESYSPISAPGCASITSSRPLGEFLEPMPLSLREVEPLQRPAPSHHSQTKAVWRCCAVYL